MAIRAGLLAALLSGLLLAGCCRPVVIPDGEARREADETMSSFARSQGLDPHRYRLHMIQSTPDCPWLFEYRFDGDKARVVAVSIDKYGRVEVSSSTPLDADTTSAGRKDGGLRED